MPTKIHKKMEPTKIATGIAVLTVWVVIMLLSIGLGFSADTFKYTAKSICRKDTLALIDYYVTELCSYSANLSREIHLDHKLKQLNMYMAVV